MSILQNPTVGEYVVCTYHNEGLRVLAGKIFSVNGVKIEFESYTTKQLIKCELIRQDEGFAWRSGKTFMQARGPNDKELATIKTLEKTYREYQEKVRIDKEATSKLISDTVKSNNAKKKAEEALKASDEPTEIKEKKKIKIKPKKVKAKNTAKKYTF